MVRDGEILQTFELSDRDATNVKPQYMSLVQQSHRRLLAVEPAQVTVGAAIAIVNCYWRCKTCVSARSQENQSTEARS